MPITCDRRQRKRRSPRRRVRSDGMSTMTTGGGGPSPSASSRAAAARNPTALLVLLSCSLLASAAAAASAGAGPRPNRRARRIDQLHPANAASAFDRPNDQGSPRLLSDDYTYDYDEDDTDLRRTPDTNTNTASRANNGATNRRGAARNPNRGLGTADLASLASSRSDSDDRPTLSSSSSTTIKRARLSRQMKEEDGENGNNNDKNDPEKGQKDETPSPTVSPTITFSPTPTGGDTLIYLGEDGPFGRCEGDCDSDKDCQSGLTCFERDDLTPVPNCEGEGIEKTDYCACYDDSSADGSDADDTFSFVDGDGIVQFGAACGYFALDALGYSVNVDAEQRYNLWRERCKYDVVEDGSQTGDEVRDLCRFTCGVCVDVEVPVETREPTAEPTPTTEAPVAAAVVGPTAPATSTPTFIPTAQPVTAAPVTPSPTVTPGNPTQRPTTARPTDVPTDAPTASPVAVSKTGEPSPNPTVSPYPTVSPAPTTYQPVTTVTYSVGTQVVIFDPSDGYSHIMVAQTGWTRADYLMDSLVEATGRLLEERLGLEVVDHLDEEDDGDGEAVEGVDADEKGDEEKEGATEKEEEGSEDGGGEGERDGGGGAGEHGQRRRATSVKRTLRLKQHRAAAASEGARTGSDSDGDAARPDVVLELSWDGSELTHLELDTIADDANANTMTEAEKEESGTPGVAWQSASLRYWINAVDEQQQPDNDSDSNNMISMDHVDQISTQVEMAVTVAIVDGTFLEIVQEVDEKVVGLASPGREHESNVNFIPLARSPYTEPVDPKPFDPIRVAGMALFGFALCFSICLARVSIRRKRKRAKKVIWGSLGTDKDVDQLLNVGLIMNPDGGDGSTSRGHEGTSGSGKGSGHGRHPSDGDGGAGADGGSDDSGPGYVPQVLASPMSKEELGYSNDNSMLMGGYQRTMQIASTPVVNEEANANDRSMM